MSLRLCTAPRSCHLRIFAKHLNGIRWYSSEINDKYSAKLAEKAKQQGVTVAELLEKSREVRSKKFDPLGLKAEIPRALKEIRNSHKSSTEEKNATAPLDSVQIPSSAASTKELSTYIDVEKFRLHSKQEIEVLWKARFINSENEFCGSMTPEAFSKLYINARRYPTFVLPLPRGEDSIELHYVQWSFLTSKTIHCIITSLAEYKLHGEYAHPHTTVMLHTDLADRGSILVNTALMNNEMPMDLAVLLTLNLQRFYTASPTSEPSKEKLELLKSFNSGDANFSTDRLIAAAETLD